MVRKGSRRDQERIQKGKELYEREDWEWFSEPKQRGVGCIIGENVKFGMGVKVGNYSIIQSDCEIGAGTEIMDFVLIKKGTVIGKNSYMDSYTISSGQNHIGDNVVIRYQTMIARGVTVEDDCYLCAGVKTVYVDHRREQVKGIVIGKGCFVGDDVKIMSGIKVAPGTILGAGCVVTKDITEKGTYIGMPARKLESRKQ